MTVETTRRGDSFSLLLAPEPISVSVARRAVRELLTANDREDLSELSELLVSEVVTNALLHAGTEIDVAATVDHTGVRIVVGDGSAHLPSRRHYAATAGTGRGLMMLESLVDDWGVARREGGKTVWFHMSGADTELEGSLARAGLMPAVDNLEGVLELADLDDRVPVELRNMPLLLHAAWQEHAEALLREYLLARLDVDGEDPIQVHADATDAIAVLEEHIPRARVAITPDELMADATEPLVSAVRVEVPVPVGSVPHFATLDRVIEEALDLSREGLVLTPPTQPEVQAFRRWLCDQVVRQAAGHQAQPWQIPLEPEPDPLVPEQWSAGIVTEATTGIIAANERSHIVAVSLPAAALLGYDDPQELVGRRIASIVPERYRQAHVAGFTMYLLAGRKPLLDRTVVVPALRRDGSEVTVELIVRAEPVAAGGSVLLADIRAAD